MFLRGPRGIAITCGAGLVLAAATARAEPRLDVGGFVGADRFGADIELGNAWADDQVPGTSFLLGARAGLAVFPDLAPASALDPGLGVEVEARLATSFTGAAGGRASYFAPVTGARVHLIGRLGLGGRVTPHLVVGGGLESVMSTSPYVADDTDAVFYWGPGATWTLGPGWGLRLDLRHGLTAGRMGDLASTFELQLGFERNFALGGGGGPPVGRVGGDGEVAALDTDGDRDGVPDRLDRCPDQAEDRQGQADDDGCPDLDADHDGVATADRCPTEPEDRDGHDDADGCPDPDNDGDGVDDRTDACPDAAETRNTIDDGDGCPDELPARVQKISGAIAGVSFGRGKARLRRSSSAVLDEIADVLRTYRGLRIAIAGVTGERGAAEANVELSRRRADAVKWYLVDQGIAADRITSDGKSADKGTAARIEIQVIAEPVQAPAKAPAPAKKP